MAPLLEIAMGAMLLAVCVGGSMITPMGSGSGLMPMTTVSVSPNNSINLVGDNVTLTCVVSETMEQANITWRTTANVTPLPDPSQSDVNISLAPFTFTSSLSLVNITADYTGTYTCAVVVEDMELTDTAVITVATPPIITIIEDIDASVADRVTLTCTVTSPVVVNITWSTTANVTLPEPVLRGSQQTNFTSAITIDRVVLDHDGVYVCTAVNIAGRDMESTNLSVTALPPEIISITEDTDVTFGDTISLSCVVESRINVTITWSTTAGVTLPVPLRSGDLDSNFTSTITIDTTTLAHEGDYVCTAVNTVGMDDDNITLSIIVPPPMIQPIMSQSAVVGDDLSFFCNATGVNLTYEWSLSSGQALLIGVNTDTVMLQNINTSDAGVLTCKVTDIRRQTATVNTEITVQGLEFTIVPNRNYTLSDDDILNFTCAVRAPPNTGFNITILWFFNGVPELSEDNVVVVTNDGAVENASSTVMITGARPENRGMYVCRASLGSRRSSISTTAEVDVEFAPFFEGERPVFRLDRFSRQTIDCPVQGSPTPMVSLFRNEVLVLQRTIRLFRYHFPAGRPFFNDSGMYVCVARNFLGSVNHSVEVIVQDRPEPITVFNTTITSITEILLNWTIPDYNFAPIHSHNLSFKVAGVDEFTVQNISGTENTNRLTVKFNKQYTIQISACNDVGCGDPARVVVFSARPDNLSVIQLQAPRILVNGSSAFIRWLLPDIAGMTPVNTTVSYRAENRNPLYAYTSKNNITLTGLLPATFYDVFVTPVFNLGGGRTAFGTVSMANLTTRKINEEPSAPTVVDMEAISSRTNPQLVISWTRPSEEDGGNLLSMYIVTIETSTPTSRRRRATSVARIPVALDTTTYSQPATPFTQYVTQVLGGLITGNTVPITGRTTVSTAEQPSSPPLYLRATSRNFTDVILSWEVPANPNGMITEYLVKFSVMSSTRTDNVGKSLSLRVSNLKADTEYDFMVFARNRAGDGDVASLEVTTLAGVFPFASIRVQGNTLTLPSFSDEWGPLSHYVIVVSSTEPSTTNVSDDTLLPFSNPQRPTDYYVTASIASSAFTETFVIGNNALTVRNGVRYLNAPLGSGQTYYVFVRLYSGARQPYQPWRNSNIVVIETPEDLTPILVPVILLLIVLIGLILIIAVLIIYCVHRSTVRRGQYIEVMKSESFSKGYVGNLRQTSSVSKGNSNDVELKGMSSGPRPNLSVFNADVFTSTGHNTLLLCEVSAPTAASPLNVTWSKDGKTLEDPHYLIMADHSLLIKETMLYDEGVYTVRATTSTGRSAEEHIRVTVLDPQPPDSDADHPPLSVSEFTERMAILRSSMDEGLDDEYADVELEWNFTSYSAKLPVNHNKNRYVNIIPYDHSRVQLSIQDNQSGSDYINASFIDGYEQPNAYIASQGPVPAAFPDFWRMIWEYDVPTIVMVTNLKEDEKIKCHQYWPSYGSMVYGNLQVTLREVENLAEYSIRTFQVSQVSSHGRGSSPAKEVRQFHFLVWPDHGVPVYATALLSFRKRVFTYHNHRKEPMLVHCSAGVGRTGTFITVDYMLKKINAEAKLDIFNFVRHMRFRRNYMVQTVSQYEFIHDSLLEAIMCGDTSVHTSNLTKRIAELKSIDPSTNKTKFAIQLEVLESASTTDEEFDCSVAQLPDNAAKNRLKQHLPPNDYRVVLSTTHHDSDYICASIIDGYRQRSAFIVTQAPMQNTTGDFWRMVWEQKSSAIVMLTQLVEGGQEMCVQYWPETVGQSEVYGTFQVEVCGNERVLGEYIVRKLKLSPVDMPQESRTITQFHYTHWSEQRCPTAAADLIDLIGEVLRVQRKSGNGPITVHCSNGLGRTGTFCALFTVLERVKTEQVVDIFMTVKSLRIQRAGLLQTLDQYQFVHRAVVEFLGSFDNYENFK